MFGNDENCFPCPLKLVPKGPDRGKWPLDVKAEADAPLITLESVVRGVQHRSGDVELHLTAGVTAVLIGTPRPSSHPRGNPGPNTRRTFRYAPPLSHRVRIPPAVRP